MCILKKYAVLYGGIIVWHTEAMNKFEFLQTVGSILSTYLPIQSSRSAIVRGVEKGHSFDWPGILACVLLTTEFVIFSISIFIV